MKKRTRLLLLLFGDAVALNIAAVITFYYRFMSGAFANPIQLYWTDAPLPFLVLTVAWMGLFAFNGLYAIKQTISRADELLTIWKVAIIAVLLLFLLTMEPANPLSQGRKALLLYGVLIAILVGVNHFLVHTVHRNLLARGRGHQNTLLVGWNPLGKEYYEKIAEYPALGLNVIGFVTTAPERCKGECLDNGPEVLGGVENLPALIKELDVSQIVIALESSDHDRLLDIIRLTENEPVSLKIIPDLYDIISGQARTNQIYGIPLIEIMPEIMPVWERVIKRGIDVLVSGIALLLFTPFWIIIALAIKLDSKGPVIYKQERVGKDGEVFNIYKFRSMVQDAEKETGPVWAKEDDPRITNIGRLLRRLRLDEIPQLLNVLKGEMSLVGPRPERPVFAREIQKELPLYSRRWRVRPGITGWAQVKHSYDATLEDVKRKLEYDLFYIENMSLRMDLKILLNTFWVMLMGKGH